MSFFFRILGLIFAIISTVGFTQSIWSAPDIFVIVSYGDLSSLKKALADDQELIKAKDQNGCTLLHRASGARAWRVTQGPKVSARIENMDYEKVEFLLDKGIDVNSRDNWGNTPLDGAVASKKPEIVKLLISRGAKVNTKEKVLGSTPLHFTGYHLSRLFGLPSYNRNLVIIAEILLKNGANVNAKDNKGRTPLDYAIECKDQELINLLKKHGAKKGSQLK